MEGGGVVLGWLWKSKRLAFARLVFGISAFLICEAFWQDYQDYGSGFSPLRAMRVGLGNEGMLVTAGILLLAVDSMRQRPLLMGRESAGSSPDVATRKPQTGVIAAKGHDRDRRA